MQQKGHDNIRLLALATWVRCRIHSGFILFTIFLVPFSASGSDFSFAQEFEDLGRRLTQESREYITAPVQPQNFTVLAGVLGATTLAFVFDTEIRSDLRSNHSSPLKTATEIGATLGNPLLHAGIAALIYSGGVYTGSVTVKDTGAVILEALVISDTATFLIKEATGRGRPFATGSKSSYRPFQFRENYDSFPSMHTSSSFALASVLSSSIESIPSKVAIYSAATFVGFSRMYQNKHWASDIVFGAAIGELAGRIAYNFHRKGGLTIVPQVYSGGAGMALVTTW